MPYSGNSGAERMNEQFWSLPPYVRHKGQSYPKAKSLSISPVTHSFARFISDWSKAAR